MTTRSGSIPPLAELMNFFKIVNTYQQEYGIISLQRNGEDKKQRKKKHKGH